MTVMTSAQGVQGADGVLPTMTSSPSLLPSLAKPDASLSTNRLPLTDLKNLARDFSRAQKSEVLALEHQHSLEKLELSASHRAQMNDWEKKELEKRHRFFEEHSKGPERRVFIKDFVERRNVLLKAQADERTRRIHEQDVHRNSLRQDQIVKAKEFSDCLEKGEIPPRRLWPESK